MRPTTAIAVSFIHDHSRSFHDMRRTTLSLLLSVAGLILTPSTLFAQEDVAEEQNRALQPVQDALPTQIKDAAATEPDGVQWEFTTTGDIAVVSMSQGFTGRLVKLLQQLELVDEDSNWVGGDTHLVYLGNLFGYGDSNLEGLYLLHKLSKQAEEAGGHVHFLLGGTDMVNLRGALSTMPPRAYSHLATDDSQARLDERLAQYLDDLWEYNEGVDDEIRKNLQKNYTNFFTRANQPGSMEFLDVFAPGTEIGDWFRSINTVITINDILFVSGGLHPAYSDISFDRINAFHRSEFNKTLVFAPVMADTKMGPYVWRGLSFPTVASDSFDVGKMLDKIGVRLMVVGHSPSQYGETMLRGRVLHVDSNFMAPREQAAYNAAIFNGDMYIVNNAGRERTLRVPPLVAPKE